MNSDVDYYRQEIVRLKKEKNAIILGHYYQRDDIQQLSDFIGDSLALAQKAQDCKNDIIVFCGVHFMAETAKILNPSRKVLLPDASATCSLAECCSAEDFSRFKANYPDHIVISYVNCSSEIKTLSDIICTSGNAEQIIRSLPLEQKIIFAPDKNLGGYINRKTGRNMVLWDGVCTVHDSIKPEQILKLKQQHPDAAVIAHPECPEPVLGHSDFVGSTKAMLKYISTSKRKTFIVVTEAGILCQMKQDFPNCEFYPIYSPNGIGCLQCDYMKQNNLENLYICLRDEKPEIILSPEIISQACKPINRMLDISRQLGLIQ